MLNWIKEHFESIGALLFGFGGVYYQHRQHGTEIDKLKTKIEKYDEDITEIKGDIKTLLERTKKL